MNERVARYQEKIVIVKGPFDQKYLDSLLRDARRIMGLEPHLFRYPGDASGKQPTEFKMKPQRGFCLVPPKENSGTWKYAQRLLSLEPPVVAIFFQGVTYPVSEKDLEYLD